MAKIDYYSQIDLRLPEHYYPIIICRGGLNDPQLLRSYVQSQQVCIVTNQTIAPLYLTKLHELLAPIQCEVVILADGEKFKNQDSLFTIYNELLQKKFHRDSYLIALGGGVIGDLAGFAASTYQRGIKLIQIPTSLLAQIDASIGGKTAINHPLGKNMIGSFYHPELVLIDIDTLSTLPEREFKSGLAEMIKYGLLVGGDFFDELVLSLKTGLNDKNPKLNELIRESCQIKVNLVVKDERETGQRALLNLGHTFAHALETYTKYQLWFHGEAVAIGLYCAALLSVKLRLLEEKWLNQIKEMLINAGLPYTIPAMIDIKKLMDIMRLDKKIKNNNLSFILIKKPGYCYIEDKVDTECLYKILCAAQGE